MNWSASNFFRILTERNRLALEHGFRFCEISGLQGLEAALQNQHANNLVCVSDISEGYINLHNTPCTRSVKTVFLAMQCPIDNPKERERCMDTMRELFRQFMSVLIREKIRIEEKFIYIDDRISFNEIERYFYPGAACAFFNIAVDKYTDLRLHRSEWIEDTDRVFTEQFNISFS